VLRMLVCAASPHKHCLIRLPAFSRAFAYTRIIYIGKSLAGKSSWLIELAPEILIL
jgi:hypothetical protein